GGGSAGEERGARAHARARRGTPRPRPEAAALAGGSARGRRGARLRAVAGLDGGSPRRSRVARLQADQPPPIRLSRGPRRSPSDGDRPLRESAVLAVADAVARGPGARPSLGPRAAAAGDLARRRADRDRALARLSRDLLDRLRRNPLLSRLDRAPNHDADRGP